MEIPAQFWVEINTGGIIFRRIGQNAKFIDQIENSHKHVLFLFF